MAIMYCNLCERPVDAHRKIGVGTLILVFFTGGLGLLAILFYKKRCPVCHTSELSECTVTKVSDSAQK